MTITRSVFLLVVSLVCLVVAELLETSVLHGGDYHVWVIGGLIAFIASFLP